MNGQNGNVVASTTVEGLYVDPTIPRYTRPQLVAEMAERLGSFTDGTFRKYQDKGLIAAPRQDRRWLPGQPGSNPALWSDNDRRMLIAVLELRERHRREEQGQLSLADLANFVVWSWAYWDGYVELPQVKKALATWVRPQLQARNKKQLRRLAGQAVRRLAADGASRADRTAAAEQLKTLYWHDDPGELLRLDPALRAVIDPQGTGRRLGPGHRPVDADDIILAMQAHFLAADALVHNPNVLTEEDWTVSRAWARQGWAQYCRDWDNGLVGPDDVFADERPDQGLQLRSAGRAVLHGLGMRLIERCATNAE
jgi:hypothetical protein